MTIAVPAPSISSGLVRFHPPVGIPFPSTDVRDRLRRTVPPPVLQALVGLGDQLENQVLAPLLSADTPGELATVFQRLHPTFARYYVAIGLRMVAALGEDVQRFRVLLAAGSEEAERMILSHGPDRIGRDATLAALFGIRTMVRVSRAASRIPMPEQITGEWVATVMAQMLASFAVFFALTQPTLVGRKAQNAMLLAHWSRHYAVRVYDLSKRLGLLTAPPAPGLLPKAGDAEDLLLANAGLEDYARLLAVEEERDAGGQSG